VLVWHLSLLRLLPLLRARAARVVLVLSGIEAWRPPDWLTRRLLRRVDLFLSISDHTWRRFVELNPEFRTAPHRTVHLGIGTPVEGRLSDPADPPAVLTIGRLLRAEDYKGHREMIRAWPRVLQRHPTAELWIAGDGDLRPDLERMVGAGGLGARVRFHGRVSDGVKEALLTRCRCLAMPSRGEGFGLVYVEAMRMARPCLVGAADAGLEVVDPPEAGLAVDPRDGRALADALCRLLEPGPEWIRWSAAARRRYEGSFTAEHFRERLLAALREAGVFNE
jgi:phosphatidylinositol alpha-1,6-mannosyltransferase